MDDYKYLFKVVLVGNSGVGKTCLVRQFTQGMFPPGQAATIGVDFMISNIDVDGDKVKLQIWDTAGQERFRSITQSYYRSASAVVIAYDVTMQPSFDAVALWLQETTRNSAGKALLCLVGNKTDAIGKREVPQEVGAEFARAHDMTFVETSALASQNVRQLFVDIARELTHRAREEDAMCSSHYSSSDATGVSGLCSGRSISGNGTLTLSERLTEANCCDRG